MTAIIYERHHYFHLITRARLTRETVTLLRAQSSAGASNCVLATSRAGPPVRRGAAEDDRRASAVSHCKTSRSTQSMEWNGPSALSRQCNYCSNKHNGPINYIDECPGAGRSIVRAWQRVFGALVSGALVAVVVVFALSAVHNYCVVIAPECGHSRCCRAYLNAAPPPPQRL